MPSFAAFDGTELAYHLHGEQGPLLVCVPGGPMQDSVYLGDLGGLAAEHRLVMLDPRGTGASDHPSDVSTYRCDRLVDDLEALREHLGLERIDVLAHSAGTNVAVAYAARYPSRVTRLVLVTPSASAVGLTVTDGTRLDVARLRADEPWFNASFAALQGIVAGEAVDDDGWSAIDPFSYGRWDAAAQAHRDAADRRRNDEAAAVFGADGAFDPERTRASLAELSVPVLFVAGAVDISSPPPMVVEYSSLVPRAELIVLPKAGHFPWLDDADRFSSTVAGFLLESGR